jgi:tetratricopeptide (TPR) repeat protein
MGLFILATGLFLACGTADAAVVTSAVQGESLLAADPGLAQSYIDFAGFYLDAGNAPAAAEILERGKVHAFVTADLLVALGHAYQQQKLWSRAEGATREALVLDEAHVGAHVQLGEIYLALGWTNSGLDSFRAAVALAPGNILPQVRLVGGLCESGQVAEAEETCLRFIADDPEHVDLWIALGRIFEKEGKHREAFTTYGQALTLDPASSVAWARQGKLFCEFGQFESAAQSCRRALQLNEDDALAHAYLGIALSHLGAGDEARAHAQIAEAAGLNMTAVWKALDR